MVGPQQHGSDPGKLTTPYQDALRKPYKILMARVVGQGCCETVQARTQLWFQALRVDWDSRRGWCHWRVEGCQVKRQTSGSWLVCYIPSKAILLGPHIGCKWGKSLPGVFIRQLEPRTYKSPRTIVRMIAALAVQA